MKRYMVMRKADVYSEAGVFDDDRLSAMARYREELRRAGVLKMDEELHPSVSGVRVHFHQGRPTIVQGPFDGDQLLAGFAMIEVASRQEAIEWLKRWPVQDGRGEALLELRDTGCPGGVAEVIVSADARQPSKQRYAVLLKSDADMEAERIADPRRLDAMSQRNGEGKDSGVLLGAQGLQSSAKGLRVKFSRGKPAVIDGPFTEIKELVAGYWVLQADSIQGAIDWVCSYPYPMDNAVVEIRPLYEPSQMQATAAA